MTIQGTKAEYIKLSAAGIAIFLSVIPFAMVSHLPLVDLPNHLARFYIYQNLETNPYLAAFYEWHWAVLPTLALDVLILPVALFLPIEQAGNLIVMLALVATYAGTILLDRQLHGEDWGVSIFAGIILYSGALRMGFVNYVIGVSFAILLFVFWRRMRDSLSLGKLLMFTVAGALLLMAHLYAFGIYAICVTGSELARLLSEPRPFRFGRLRDRLPLAMIGLTLLLPLGLLVLCPPSPVHVITRWSNLQWKVDALLTPIFFNQPWVELPLLIVVVSVVGAGLALGALRLSKPMLPVLLLFAILLIIMPRIIYGSSHADFRLLSGVGFLVVASLKFSPTSLKWRLPMIFVATVCLFVRVGSVLADWVSVQPTLAEYDTALVSVPPGSKLLVLQGSRGLGVSADRHPPLQHEPVFAAAKQGVLVGYIFTVASTPLKLRPEFASYEQVSPFPTLAADMARFDYVMTLDKPIFEIPTGLSLSTVGQGQTYVLSRVNRDAATTR